MNQKQQREPGKSHQQQDGPHDDGVSHICLMGLFNGTHVQPYKYNLWRMRDILIFLPVGLRSAAHHPHVAPHHPHPHGRTGWHEFSIDLKNVFTIGLGDLAPLQGFGAGYFFKIQFSSMETTNLVGITMGEGIPGFIGYQKMNDIRLLSRR